jgi:hypothetical protein
MVFRGCSFDFTTVGVNVGVRKPGVMNSNEGETRVMNSRTGHVAVVMEIFANQSTMRG